MTGCIHQQKRGAGRGAEAGGVTVIKLALLGSHVGKLECGHSYAHVSSAERLGSSSAAMPRKARGLSASIWRSSLGDQPRYASCSANIRRHSGCGGAQREKASVVRTT